MRRLYGSFRFFPICREKVAVNLIPSSSLIRKGQVFGWKLVPFFLCGACCIEKMLSITWTLFGRKKFFVCL